MQCGVMAHVLFWGAGDGVGACCKMEGWVLGGMQFWVMDWRLAASRHAVELYCSGCCLGCCWVRSHFCAIDGGC